MARSHRWVYLPLKNGATANGFLAGPVVGVWCHWMGRSRPCRRLMSDGALSCAMCADAQEPDWRGYVPFYSAEYVRMFTVITADYLESVREIPLHAQIKMARGRNKHDPVVIRPDLWRTTPLPPAADRDAAADLVPFLLKMWKDAELIEWHLGSDAPLSSGPECGPVNRLAAPTLHIEEPPQKGDTRSGADILGAVLDGIGGDDEPAAKSKPHRNGKPHK